MCHGSVTALPFISFTYIGPSRVLILCCVISAAFPLVQLLQLFFIFLLALLAASCELRRRLVMGCCSICIPISRCQNDSTHSLRAAFIPSASRLFGHSMKDIPTAASSSPCLPPLLSRLRRWPQHFNCYAGAAQRKCTNVGGIKNN